YLMIKPENVDKPDYLTPSETLEELIASIKAENTFVDVQYPTRGGNFFDWTNKITYSYWSVSVDDQRQLESKLREFTKP
ncbi:unnamed protein product, partial [marine sediment metagenome]